VVATDFFIWVGVMWVTTAMAINSDTGEEVDADGRRVAVLV
jgi:hypothetical protein